MAKQVIWVLNAQKDRLAILSYWEQRNKSKTYSKKLDFRFREAIDLICKYPLVGKPTVKASVRIKIIDNYLLLYEVTANYVVVLRIWDSRRNPEELKY